MDQLRNALEWLDEGISDLEDKVGLTTAKTKAAEKKQADLLKATRAREAGVLAVAQKVAARLDETIEHVEHILRH